MVLQCLVAVVLAAPQMMDMGLNGLNIGSMSYGSYGSYGSNAQAQVPDNIARLIRNGTITTENVQRLVTVRTNL